MGNPPGGVNWVPRAARLTMEFEALKHFPRPLFAWLSSGARTSQVAQWVKNPPAMQEMQADTSSIPGLGRSPGGGHGNPLQYSRLENQKDRGA